jgi:hypothetical protein
MAAAVRAVASQVNLFAIATINPKVRGIARIHAPSANVEHPRPSLSLKRSGRQAKAFRRKNVSQALKCSELSKANSATS